jgi:hypothetical protein
MRTAPYRWSFLFGVALVAAAVGNACVETVSNAGYFGSGYHDNDHASVVPAIAGGLVLLLQIAVVRVLALLRGTASDGSWFARTASDISHRGPVRDLPVLLGMQFCALYAMEAAEALLASGHVPEGITWLGGPPLFSIVAHVALGSLCAVLFARGMRAVVDACVGRATRRSSQHRDRAASGASVASAPCVRVSRRFANGERSSIRWPRAAPRHLARPRLGSDRVRRHGAV